ncbi:M16 family metallopeptidase [Dongia rigui]|uniref:Pitrilysin family protein n=1 Tax=Dongia rigui TaxID=940149 RepID=A0ABU5E4E6_9PROT|nr:pitrilysin family protein [Dongia rigui]MDY0874500.1 pitrilysin family protein [Dongia rigui]
MMHFLRTALAVAVLSLLPRLAAATEIQKIVSPAGIEVWLVEDHTVPVISLSFGWDGGTAMDPKGKEGVAMLASGLMDEGAGDIDSATFQRKIADLGLDYGFDASADSFSGSLRTLTANKDAAVDLLALALTKPRFDAEPVERMRRQFLIAIDGEQRDPNAAAYRALEKKLLGDHPYARSNYGTKESMSALTPDDLRQFMKDRLTRDHLFVAAAGDINAEDLGKLVDRAFAGLPEKGVADNVPEAKVADAGSLSVLTRNVPQATVIFAQPGIKRADKDFFAVYLMNYVLGGGGFSSRLMTEIREKRGLSYGVNTDLVTLDHVGFLSGRYETPNAKVKETLDLLRAEWQRMAEKGPTQAELDDARTYLLGYYPRNLTTTSKAAETLLGIQMEGLGIDYIERRRTEIEAVTLDDVKRMAKTLLNDKALTVVVAGKPEGLEGAVPVQ